MATILFRPQFVKNPLGQILQGMIITNQFDIFKCNYFTHHDELTIIGLGDITLM